MKTLRGRSVPPVASAWIILIQSLRFTYRHIGILIVGNLFWWILSLPVITMPPATLGLYYLVQRLRDDEDAEQTTWKDLFTGFRIYWLKGWLLIILDLIVILMSVIPFIFYITQKDLLLKSIAAPTFLIMLCILGLQIYLLPLMLEQQDKRIFLVCQNSIVLMMNNLRMTYELTGLLIILIIVCILLAGPVLFLLISLIAVIHTFATGAAIQHYYANQEL